MDFHVSGFEVVLVQHRSMIYSFSVVCYYLSDEPGSDGKYVRSTRHLLTSEQYSSYENNFSRIMNLCTPSRLAGVWISPDLVDPYSDSHVMCTIKYYFRCASDLRAFANALDFYNIDYSYVDTPF